MVGCDANFPALAELPSRGVSSFPPNRPSQIRACLHPQPLARPRLGTCRLGTALAAHL